MHSSFLGVQSDFSVGDYVEFNDLKGYITEISLRSTVIQTLTQIRIVVPNSDLATNRITNWTYNNAKGWVPIPINVTHESDPLLVIEVLSPRLDVWNRNPNIVIASDLKNYPQNSVLQQAPESNLGISSKPIPVRDLLKQLPFFRNCTELELRKLVEIGYRKRLKPLEVLYQEGDPGDAFYLILAGSVSYTLENIPQTTTMKTGQFVGEFSLMLNVPRTVTVKANEETTLFVLSPRGFKKLLRDQPHLYDVIVEEMARHEEELLQQGRQLRKLGLINSEEYNRSPVDWVRQHLEKLFGP